MSLLGQISREGAFEFIRILLALGLVTFVYQLFNFLLNRSSQVIFARTHIDDDNLLTLRSAAETVPLTFLVPNLFDRLRITVGRWFTRGHIMWAPQRTMNILMNAAQAHYFAPYVPRQADVDAGSAAYTLVSQLLIGAWEKPEPGSPWAIRITPMIVKILRESDIQGSNLEVPTHGPRRQTMKEARSKIASVTDARLPKSSFGGYALKWTQIPVRLS